MSPTASTPIARRGLMLVLSSPSGAGKSTIARRLIEKHPDLGLSISVTTRGKRASEVGDREYHFIDRAQFERMRERGELLESAEVHGNFYGTPRDPVEKALAGGQDMLFDIDWQGTQQLAKAMPDDLVRVFVLPPSMDELRSRLVRRAEDEEGVIARRLANARAEIGHWTEYEYIIVNERVEDSLEAVSSILIAERHRRERSHGLAQFIGTLTGGT
jgi:guanylate kinase